MQAADQPREERKLAAIMLTDLVGFTSMAQSNEALAMEILAEHKQMVRPILQRYGGREIKTMGDAFLIEFPNALDAVRCAVEVQEENRKVNSGRTPERRVMIRIGIHVGDVIHNKGDIFGDAVNISSRIEPLANPGGVCISQQVYDQVWNKVDFRLVKMEPRKFKNVILPTDVYSVEMLREEKATKTVELDRLRVAVLPLSNMSPDPNDEYFADGMTEELITALSGISGLTVIARTSVMSYKTAVKRVAEIGRELGAGTIIEGSVRKAANKVRISVQVIDARNEGHLWAQNYDKELNDVFAVQSEIAEKVAETLRVNLLESGKGRWRKMLEVLPTETTPTGSSEAHTLYLKGRYYWNLGSKEALEKALEYFKAAVEADPGFALGYSGLGECYGFLARIGQADPETVYTKAIPNVTKALELNPNLAEAHSDLAAFMFDYEHKPKKSESEFRKAIELNPNYANAHQFLSHVLCSERRFNEAFAEIRRAVELDPLSRFINLSLGDTLYYLGEYEKAIEQFKKVIELDPNYDAVYLSLIQAYLRKSMYDEALRATEKYAELSGNSLESKQVKAYVYASMGNKEEAHKLLAQVKERFGEEPPSSYLMSIIHFVLGETDVGFEWLNKAYNQRDANITLMNVDTELENVKSDPRFLSLLEKVGLSGEYGASA